MFIAVFAADIIRIISSEAFVHTEMYGYTAVHAMQIVAWIFLFYFIASLANYTLIASGEQKKILFVNLAIALLNALGNLLLIPHYSFIGSAVTTLATQVVLVVIMWFLVRRHYDNKDSIFKAGYFLLIAGIS